MDLQTVLKGTFDGISVNALKNTIKFYMVLLLLFGVFPHSMNSIDKINGN